MRAALEVAHANITAYHQAQRHADAVHHNGGIMVRELQRPVDRAACYVPSALAPLVSTVLMTAVPAKVAGVPEVVLVTSPAAGRHAWRRASSRRPPSPASTRCTGSAARP